MSVTLGELAVRHGCELRGDPDVPVSRVSTLTGAGQDAVAFLVNPRYRPQLADTRAAAVVVDAETADMAPGAVLVARDPYATFARIAWVLHPPAVPRAGVHASAVVDPSAAVDPSAEVGALCVIGAGVSIGPRCVIGPGSLLADGVALGSDVRLVARVVLGAGVSLGARCIIQPGVVVGSDGFGYAPENGTWLKVPQLGSVRIGADVEIGANTAIDRGALDDTVIGDGAKLDNQIHIAHNVRIGEHTAIAACVGVAGSAVIGRRCQIGGAVGIVGHLEICDDVAITGFSMVVRSITRPGLYSGGIPAEDARTWRRIVGRVRRLDELVDRVKRLERSSGSEKQ